MAWSPWSKGNTESNPIRAQHHGVQVHLYPYLFSLSSLFRWLMKSVLRRC
ncbi:hypothetical protein OsI_12093 [Oryza sativa Indica Group]|uniref:Uncharacterized protein n=1 Tax=Oryza sativa subsp. indica TaxID=39946 RepID=B8AK39_ORYSI|nr:hypothetical protein OsI_12093 [Oryza sativa Indica Group]